MALSVPVPKHLEPRPEDGRSRLGRLGHPDELTGMEPPVQRFANYLIAAERNLSHVQSRYFEAQRSGDERAIAAAAARKDAAQREIGRLRVQLYSERRRELLARGTQAVDAAEGSPSLIQRLLGR